MTRRRRAAARATGLAQLDPADPIGNVAAALVLDGAAWFVRRVGDRLLDRLQSRGEPADPRSLPATPPDEMPPTGNVRLTP